MKNQIWPNEKGYIVKEKGKVKMDAECEVVEHLYKSCLGEYYKAPLCIEMREKYKKCFGRDLPFE